MFGQSRENCQLITIEIWNEKITSCIAYNDTVFSCIKYDLGFLNLKRENELHP